MAFMLLGVTPLSEAYDFIGSPSHGLRAGDEESTIVETAENAPVEEVPLPDEEFDVPEIEVVDVVEEAEPDPVEEAPVEEVVVPVMVKEELSKKKPEASKVNPISPVKQTTKSVGTKLPEPTETLAPKKYMRFVEYSYDTFSGNNPMDKLPPSEFGNYVLVYRTNDCPYCDQLISELKDNIGDYVLVSIRCNGTVRDPFYSRWISSYPAFIVIKNKRVTYYGYGYRTLEEFKKLL